MTMNFGQGLAPRNAGPEQVRNDILFWLGDQDREHNLFLKLGIDPNTRRDLYNEASRLNEAYTRAAQAQNLEELVRLSGPSQALKTEAYNAAKAGWIGWLFPVFYDHIRREIDYALRRINPAFGGASRPISAQEEICFWTQIGAEHAVMAAHLLDPTESAAIHEAMKRYTNMKSLHDACRAQIMPSMVALTERAARDLDMFFAPPPAGQAPKSVIHPVLQDHIIREGRRFIQTMEAINRPSIVTSGIG